MKELSQYAEATLSAVVGNLKDDNGMKLTGQSLEQMWVRGSLNKGSIKLAIVKVRDEARRLQMQADLLENMLLLMEDE